MPKITQGGNFNTPQIRGLTSNIQPGRAQRIIGQAVSQAADSMGNMSKEFFDKANETLMNNQYSRATSEGTKLFNERYQERLNKRVDEEGNPTFGTLATDVEQIARDVASEVSRYTASPEVAKRFSEDFSRFTSNKQVQAQKEARNQFMDYSKATLEQSTRALIDQAITDDPMNANAYIGKIDGLILDAAEGGIISQQQAFAFKNAASSEVRVTLFSNAIDADPVRALAQLQNTHVALGITESERDGLVRQAEAGIEDQQIAARKQQALLESKIREQRSITTMELELGVVTGSISSKDVIEAENSNQISRKQSLGLQKKIATRDKTEGEWSKVSASIDQQVENKGFMGHFTPKQMDKHYLQGLEPLRNKKTQDPVLILKDPTASVTTEPSLQEKAKHVGVKYTVPIAMFNKELSHNILTGSNEDAAMQSFAYLKASNPAAIASMSRDSMAVASMALNLIQGTGITPKEALAKSRDIHLNLNDEVKRENIEVFNRLPEVKKLVSADGELYSPIDNLIISEFGLDGVFGGKSFEPGNRQMFIDILKANFAETGSLSASLTMMHAQVGGVFGVTEVTEESGIFDDRERFMRLPPEIMFPGVDPERMKEDLRSTVTSKRPDIAPEDIRMRSDHLTTTASPTYGLFTISEEGNEIPIINPDTQMPMRWFPDVIGIQEQEAVEAQAELDERTQAAREERNNPSAMRKLEGLTNSTINNRGN